MKNLRKNKPLVSFKQAITGGLALFLIGGFTGCDDKNNCNEDYLKYASQTEIDECKDKINKATTTYNGSGSNNPDGSSHSNSSFWGWFMINNAISNMNNAPTRSSSSGYFSESSSGHGSSGSSSSGG